MSAQVSRRGAKKTRAFPNAYVSTDEPPRRSVAKRALCVAAAAGVGYLGMIILSLSLLTSEYNPVTQYASDYGVGTFAALMNSGFVLAGVGIAALALAAYTSRRGRPGSAGSALLLISGVALIVDGFFHTDIEGAAPTLHGAIHNFAGVAFFVFAALGVLLVNRDQGGRAVMPMLLAVIVSFALLGLNGALALGVTGLAERIIILVVFGSALVTSVRLYRLA
jgi:hypothetical membrane protein